MIEAKADPRLSDPLVLAAERASGSFPFIDIKRAAEVLERSVRTLRRWEVDGKMPARIKHGRRKVYRRDAIDAMAAQLRTSID